MKIFNLILVSLLIFTACGVKNDPIPKSSLNIPPPKDFDYKITSNGIIIKNNSEDYPLYVERALVTKSFLSFSNYKRVALIKQGDTFLDNEPIKNEKYKYRLRYYYKYVGTYSQPFVQDIIFKELVKLDVVHIYELGKKVCISSQFPLAVSVVEVYINSSLLEDNLQNNKELCVDKPESSLVNIMLMPYDNTANAGIAFSKNITQDINKNNFPPQNIRAYRNEGDIALSWDTQAVVDSYRIYLVREDKEYLLSTQNTTSFIYKSSNNKCVEFKLSAVRNGKESNKRSVTACP